MIGWHNKLNEHEFEQAPGDGERQGRLACSSPWGRKELDTTGRLNNIIIYDEVLLSHEKELSSVICSNMDGPKEYYA